MTSAVKSASALWSQAFVLGDRGRPAAAVRVCERALRRPELAHSADTHAQILITLACFRSELGDVSAALDHLDQALTADPCRRAAVLNARGMILLRNSHPDALPALDDAIDLLSAERAGEAASRLASALLNRGFIHMTDGRLTQARADTAAAEMVAAEAGRQGVVLMARHNLGYIRFLSGDLPAPCTTCPRHRR